MSNDTFEITRKIEIDAAHRVPDHKSKCFAVHGHRYVIEATCEGDLHKEGEQRGMVMDFGFLKQVMMETIHDPCDHGIILWEHDPIRKLTTPEEWETGRSAWKVKYLNKVPTAENLARVWFWELSYNIATYFRENFPELRPPELSRVRVYETPNCWADFPS